MDVEPTKVCPTTLTLKVFLSSNVCVVSWVFGVQFDKGHSLNFNALLGGPKQSLMKSKILYVDIINHEFKSKITNLIMQP